MSKWFEVDLTMWKTVLVEVNDHEDAEIAQQLAIDEFFSGDGEVDPAREVVPDGLESSKRHADEILPLYPSPNCPD